MNRKALKDLEGLMLSFPSDHLFSMDNYRLGGYSWKKETEANAVRCCTICCAAGWGTIMLNSWKKELMLKNSHIRYIRYGGLSSDQVLLKFLDIDGDEIENIFYSSGYNFTNPQPKDVAEHIRQVINGAAED